MPDIELKQISIHTIRIGWEIRLKCHFSIYDSLIIASALEANCETLYSEDLHHNQLIENKLRIVNPFV
nr:PIN domain-containing protein [Bacteroidota bacterium]